MKKRSLPAMPVASRTPAVSAELTPKALSKWDPSIRAAVDDEQRSISILEPIGEDFFSEGMTARRIAGILRHIGNGPVTVDINSPGGDMFEGFAIYNQLRAHEGEVTVRILGVAASAASIIAMAGDTVQIARAGFLMIHNAWGMVVGNRHDFSAAGETFAPFDRAMADVYSARTGVSREDASEMMDAETWIGGADAVDQGFADSLLPADSVEKDREASHKAAAHRVDVALAKQGMPRSERRRLLKEIKGDTPSAVSHGTHGAADPVPVDPGVIADLRAVLARIGSQ